MIVRQEAADIHLIDPNWRIDPPNHIHSQLITLPLLLLDGLRRSASRCIRRRMGRVGWRPACMSIWAMLIVFRDRLPFVGKRVEHIVVSVPSCFFLLDVSHSFTYAWIVLHHLCESFSKVVSPDYDCYQGHTGLTWLG
jgi:hypothetical protein